LIIYGRKLLQSDTDDDEAEDQALRLTVRQYLQKAFSGLELRIKSSIAEGPGGFDLLAALEEGPHRRRSREAGDHLEPGANGNMGSKPHKSASCRAQDEGVGPMIALLQHLKDVEKLLRVEFGDQPAKP